MSAKIDLLARIVEAKKREVLAPSGKLLDFARYFFPEREGMDFIEGPHHRVIGETLDRVLRGEISRLIVNVPPGYTKAIDCDTPMWTPCGWVAARDVGVGQYLMGSDGKWTRVIGIAPQGVKPAYRVSFNDGTSLIACGDHRWSVMQRYGGPSRIKTTDQLIGDLAESDGRKKWRIPIVSPDASLDADLPIDPYLLGCWLGDGSSHYAAITTMDAEIVSAFEAQYELRPHSHQNAGRATTYGIRGGMHRALRLLGLLNNKHIPNCYMLASPAQRLALLQGIADTDGCVSAANGAMDIASSNYILAADIRSLITSLGGVYRKFDRPSGKKTSYRTYFRLPDGMVGFRLDRKLRNATKRKACNMPRRFISSIDPVSPREMICFAVDADDHLFCAGRDFIVTHNTEASVVNFIAKGFHINPGARFIHATFSDDLARENSDKVQSLINLESYQAVQPVIIRADSKAKDRWRTIEGGGVLAKAAGGPITGFRAGYMDKTRFTGALVVDDPLKPDDAFSPVKRKTVNNRATNTFRSRLAHDGVPIIVIMQRLHDDDFCGHLLKGGTGEKWHHLNLPVLIDNSAEYPPEWTHGIPIDHGLPDGPLWADKHSLAEIEVLKADAYTFASQYMQRPVSIEGALFDMAGFKWWHELPPIDHYVMFADTAQKTGERNDFSVVQLWGKAESGIYLVDQVRGKWEAPELESTTIAFWQKHKAKNVRGLRVEDKVSGTGLIQTLRRKGVPVSGIKRDKDKYTRGLDAAPWIATGMVHLPANADYTIALRSELQTFDGLGTGHDDQVDPMMDAINEMLGSFGVNWDAFT